jgi:hypothetical protein
MKPAFCPETATATGDGSLVVGMRKAEQIPTIQGDHLPVAS